MFYSFIFALLSRGNNENYFKLLTASVETLFTNCDDVDYDVRLAAEENINKLVKVCVNNDVFFSLIELFYLFILKIESKRITLSKNSS